MEITTQHVSREAETVLTNMIGATIQTLLIKSGEINAGESVIETEVISIRLNFDNQFAIISNDWNDTLKEYIDYYFLDLQLHSEPSGIFYNPTITDEIPYTYKCDHLSVALGAAAPIAQIVLLEASVIGESEAVRYDAGLIITREDDLKIGIVRYPSIQGSLNVAHTASDILQLTNGLTVRKTFGKQPKSREITP